MKTSLALTSFLFAATALTIHGQSVTKANSITATATIEAIDLTSRPRDAEKTRRERWIRSAYRPL